MVIRADASRHKVVFVNTVCTGEDFHTGAFLPAVKLAVDEVNNNVLSAGFQLHFCNEEDFNFAATVEHVSPCFLSCCSYTSHIAKVTVVGVYICQWSW